MIFDCKRSICVVQAIDVQQLNPFILEESGLWVCLLSSGSCHLTATTGFTATAGSLIIGQAPLSLTPTTPCHLLAVCLTGWCAEDFLAGLPEKLLFAKGESCPGAAEHLQQLSTMSRHDSHAQSIHAFTLLCELADANATRQSLPPIIAQAITEMRENYAHLYGIEELSEQLGVSKSHFVRIFHAAMGVSPGKYLTNIRIEAVKRLLLHREYNLEVIASLCGFSGANYLCRVFKRETGQSPASWRAIAYLQTAPRLTETETALEHALYF